VETPPFTFGLERVRTIREKAEDEAKEELSNQLRHRAEGERLLQQAVSAMRTAADGGRSAHSNGRVMKAADLIVHQTFLERTERLRSEAALELSRRDTEVRIKRELLATAARDRQAIDKLKERQKAEFDAEWARKSQNTLDELALAVHRRGVTAA
jgi:flagellar protein FliJ